MKIRRLEFSDIDQVYALLCEFRFETGLSGNIDHSPDPTYVKKLIYTCQQNGVCLIGEDSAGQIQGIFLSMPVPDIWFPKTVRLYELIWWVSQEHRKKLLGAKLLKEYQKQAEILVKKGLIHSFTVGKSRKTDLDLEKHGFQLFESVYVFGE